jgi:hypothetical protein
VIDWANNKFLILYVRLSSLLQEIKLVTQLFEWIYFNHLYRELNVKVDTLSKEDLSLPVGALGLYEFVDGEEVESMEFQF